MSDAPNILLVCTDSLRCDALRCMGNASAYSPNADRLAGEGVMFTQAHTASPVCSPARTSLLTGLHAPAHGCLENGMGRDPQLATLVDPLRERGYHTIMAGKQHFGPCPGFDVVVQPSDEELRQLAATGEFAEDRSFADVGQVVRDAVVVDQCQRAMRAAMARGERFFAFCSLEAPHVPLHPPARCVEQVSDMLLPELNLTAGEPDRLTASHQDLLGLLGPKQEFDGLAPSDPAYWVEAVGRRYDPEQAGAIDDWRRLYYAYAVYADELLGRMLTFLDDQGVAANTLVIFTSDHGQQYFDHGFNDKHCWYDESWRVPLLLRWPGVLPAGETRKCASWLDITATVIATAGAHWPDVQGFDLIEPLRNGKASPRTCAAGTLFKSCALVTADWKLEYHLEEQTGRLYDRIRDPAEQNDLWNSAVHRPLRDALTIALLSWRGDVECTGRHRRRLVARSSVAPGEAELVAQRVARRVEGWTGREIELRLQAAAGRAVEAAPFVSLPTDN